MGELNIHEIDKYKRGFRDVRKLKMSRQKQREQERIENFKKKKKYPYQLNLQKSKNVAGATLEEPMAWDF